MLTVPATRCRCKAKGAVEKTTRRAVTPVVLLVPATAAYSPLTSVPVVPLRAMNDVAGDVLLVLGFQPVTERGADDRGSGAA